MLTEINCGIMYKQVFCNKYATLLLGEHELVLMGKLGGASSITKSIGNDKAGGVNRQKYALNMEDVKKAIFLETSFVY